MNGERAKFGGEAGDRGSDEGWGGDSWAGLEREQGYFQEANPWEELEVYGREQAERFSAKDEGRDEVESKYQEVLRAAKKALISGGILPAYVSVQALGLVAGGGVENIVESGTEIVKQIENGAKAFREHLFGGEVVANLPSAFGEKLFSFEDDDVRFEDYCDRITVGEDGHVVPSEMFYGKVQDYDGTPSQRAGKILSEMSDEELNERINERYAGLITEYEVIGTEIGAEGMSVEEIAQALTAYLTSNCRYAGEVNDPRNKWGNGGESISNWEQSLVEFYHDDPEVPNIIDCANKFIIEGRNKLTSRLGMNAGLVEEGYDAIVGGESNCFGMAAAVAIGTNYLYAQSHPDKKSPVAYVNSLRFDDGGCHAAVFYQGEEEEWRFIDPTLEVCSTRALAEAMHDEGVSDYSIIGETMMKNGTIGPCDFQGYQDTVGECKVRWVYTGENEEWSCDYTEIGDLYVPTGEAETATKK